MIYTFHKVADSVESPWYVSSDFFRSFVTRLSTKDLVYLDDYDSSNPDQAVITFDGVYANILKFAAPYLLDRKIPFECFLIGDLVGLDNTFDKGEPLEAFCDIPDLHKLMDLGARIQWHSRSHKDMSGMSHQELDHELKVPSTLLRELGTETNFRHFAFPHGKVSYQAIAHSLSSFSTVTLSDDNGEGFSSNANVLSRQNVFAHSKIVSPSLGVVVANYNYGHLLPLAIRSIESQTLKPDVIHVSDDASTDGSADLLETLGPNFNVFRNQSNLGIVDHFNIAISRLGTDYCLILGADNELRSDALEKMYVALSSSAENSVAYTDMLIFGPDSEEYASRVDLEEIGFSSSTHTKVFIRQVANFSEISFNQEYFPSFIHGSSMFRYDRFIQAGGYEKVYPEDHNLWHRMLLLPASKAVRVPFPLLRYRQHSNAQASNVLSLLSDIARLRSENKALRLQMGNPLRYLVVTWVTVAVISPAKLLMRRTLLSDKVKWVRRRSRLAKALEKTPSSMRRMIYRLAVRMRG